jgi:hypothetical protein
MTMASALYCSAKRLVSVVLAVFALGTYHSLADNALPKPTGDVILSITGAIDIRNTASGADFDLAMLEAMPKATIATSTPWTDGVTTFEGVALGDVLKRVGATGTGLNLKALNDYAAPVPVADAGLGAILAFRVNGAFISIREKGPLWLIYPFDEHPDLKREEIYSRAVWQIRSIDVLN